jgi:predicted cupin superfamily sugar epimerase
VLSETRGYQKILLGKNLHGGEVPQCAVPAGDWFAAELAPGGQWCLSGCTVAPGFDFMDFEMADRARLIESFPSDATIIAKLTRH